MSRNLTLHILSNVPYSNLNRDDAGTPKRVMQGGALRAMHSSQSIKRGIRTKYEAASRDITVRSGDLDKEVLRIAQKLRPDIDADALRKEARARVAKLVSKSDKDSTQSSWMSVEELQTLAQALINELGAGEEAEGDGTDFIEDEKTGSLAIAAFGRMFAVAANKNTEAAIAVSPGVTTHAATIESDFFATTDDVKEREHRTGGTYLGVARFVNGTFYRTISIDKEQLKRSWSAFGSEGSRENLREFLRACVYGLPRGKKNATAPYTLPSLVLAEEQRYRTAYDFETPIEPGEDGGYERPSIDELARQFKAARRFDADNFGPVEFLTGTAQIVEEQFEGAQRGSLDGLVDAVIDWIEA